MDNLYVDKNNNLIKDGMRIIHNDGTIETVKKYGDELYIVGEKSIFPLYEFTLKEFEIQEDLSE